MIPGTKNVIAIFYRVIYVFDKFTLVSILNRAGWEGVSAVKSGQIFEIKSANILQPGPAALTDGLDQIKTIIDNWHLAQ